MGLLGIILGLLGATIAAFFSFVTLISSKENKVSEFRLAWANQLRDEISELIRNLHSSNSIHLEIKIFLDRYNLEDIFGIYNAEFYSWNPEGNANEENKYHFIKNKQFEYAHNPKNFTNHENLVEKAKLFKQPSDTNYSSEAEVEYRKFLYEHNLDIFDKETIKIKNAIYKDYLDLTYKSIDARNSVSHSFAKIQLRITNHNNDSNEEKLLKTIQTIKDTWNNNSEDGISASLSALEKINWEEDIYFLPKSNDSGLSWDSALIESGRPILKSTWETVKHGEKTFKKIKKFAMYLIGFLIISWIIIFIRFLSTIIS